MNPQFPFTIDPAHCHLAREFKHTSPLIGCRFDPLGRVLFVSAQDSTLQRFDLFTGKTTAFVGHKSWVRGMAFVPEPRDATRPPASFPALDALAGGPGTLMPPPPAVTPFTLITGDYHGNLLWWPGAAENPTPTQTVEAHAGWVRAVAVSPDGQTLASCGNDSLVKLWSVAEGKPIRTLEGHTSHVYNVVFHPDGNRLVSADQKGIIKDWNWRTGAVVREFEAKALYKYDNAFKADIGGVRGIAFNGDGSLLACAGITNVSNAFAGVGNPAVVLVDWKSWQPKQELKPAAAFQGTAWGVAFHPAGYIVGAGGGNGGAIWFWKADAAASFHAVTVPQSARDMALSPDGTLIAVALPSGTAQVYSLAPDSRPKSAEPPKKK